MVMRRLMKHKRAVYVLGCLILVIGLFSISSTIPSFTIRQKLLPMLEAGLRGTSYIKYPPRRNMGECPPLYGKLSVLVIMVQKSYDTHYKAAQDTLRCYLKSTNYTFILVDLDSDLRVKKACNHTQLFFKKHCATAAYLNESDWTVVLDADTGVVNPNHCIEEWIDPRVDIIFYERFFNWEIASGNYIIKNTSFAKDFLMKWANWEFHQPKNWNGADNGALQIHILQTVLPEAKQEIENCDKIWHQGKEYNTYMAYVTCVKLYLGANRIWPGKLRILRRGHGWVRDGYFTDDKFCDLDFMLHGWKVQRIGDSGWKSPFLTLPGVNMCGSNYDEWHWRNDTKKSVKEIGEMMAKFEKTAAASFPQVARVIPYLSEPDIGKCYPHCDEPVDIQTVSTVSS